MKTRNYMLRSTFGRLCERLRYFTTERAMEVKKNLKEAKSGGGGMHDNAAYEHALLEENRLAAEITELSRKLENAVFIDDLKFDANRVGLGTSVKILSTEGGEQATARYTILGSDEADIDHKIISYLSPIGKALMGRKVGEEIEIVVPAGKMKVKILEIWKGGKWNVSLHSA